MKKVSEKINGKSMGGLMKLRFLAVVLGTIAIMTSGAAVAEDKKPTSNTGSLGMTMNIDYPIVFDNGDASPVKTKDLFATLLGLKSSDDDNGGSGISAWKCVIEERNFWDQINETFQTVTTGLLSWKALKNSENRTNKKYEYLTTSDRLNNTWRLMDSALNYSTQQQMAYYRYKYGSTYGSNSGSGNYNSGIRNYATDTYSSYTDDWFETWG